MKIEIAFSIRQNSADQLILQSDYLRGLYYIVQTCCSKTFCRNGFLIEELKTIQEWETLERNRKEQGFCWRKLNIPVDGN